MKNLSMGVGLTKQRRHPAVVRALFALTWHEPDTASFSTQTPVVEAFGFSPAMSDYYRQYDLRNGSRAWLISSVDTVNSRFLLDPEYGDVSSYFNASGEGFRVVKSGNAGVYTISGADFDGTSTRITVQEAIPSDDTGRCFRTSSVMGTLYDRPEGRRALRISFPHSEMWAHPDDRCGGTDGATEGLSSQPVLTGYAYENALGDDGLDSGYSTVWIDSWVSLISAWADEVTAEIKAAGLSVDYIILDVESKLDEWKVGLAWQNELEQHPNWPEAKARLDELKQDRTGDPGATFDTSSNWFDVEGQALDWNAYMWEHQASALTDAIISRFDVAFGGVKGSNYEHHGRDVNSGAYDLNGHEYYQKAVSGTHASDYHYGWLNQIESNRLDGVRKMGKHNPFRTFKHEQKRARAQIRAGYPIQPWVAFTGFDDSDWESGYAPTPHDPNSYWKENIRHLALLNPGPFLYWNSRTYKTGWMTVKAVDATTNTITLYADKTAALQRPGTTFQIAGSGWGDGAYTVSSATYDGVNDETDVVVTEDITSEVTPLGDVVNYASDAQDQVVDDLIAEVNTIIGLDPPRKIITKDILAWGQQEEGAAAGVSTPIPDGSEVVWTGLRHGNQVTYRVTIQRIHDDPAQWSQVVLPVYKDGVDSGETVTIAAGETGAYYTTNYVIGEVVTFQYTAPTQTNLLPEGENLGDATAWTIEDSGGDARDDGVQNDPFGGTRAYRIIRASLLSTEVAVSQHATYTVSMYRLAQFTDTSRTSAIEVLGSDGATTIASDTQLTVDAGGWVRQEVTFYTGGQTSVYIRIQLDASGEQFDTFGVLLHRGVAAGKYPY